jgi:hypothetical protein
MHTTMRITLGAAAAAVLGIAAWPPAQADPTNAKNALPITIACDNGQTYSAVVNGNGAWTPAHDLDSTAILIPVAFGPQTVTISDADGNIIDQETGPATQKPGASAHNRNATTNCSFIGSATAPDGTTFTVSGDVQGFVTPGG